MPLEIQPGLNIPDEALTVRFTRSGGPGGQNVNKVSSRVELSVVLDAIPIPAEARARLRVLAGRRVSAAGVLTVACQSSRDQPTNREKCFERVRKLVLAALVRPVERRPTRPTAASRERRIDSKRRRASVKAARARPPDGA